MVYVSFLVRLPMISADAVRFAIIGADECCIDATIVRRRMQ
jgi:hypothetical protein